MTTALAFVVGYLLGSIPFGLILTRLSGGPDVRSIGSGNIGATNVLRTGNKKLAAATLLGDMLKGTVAVLLAAYAVRAYPSVPGYAPLAAGLGAFLGHLFPVWLKFKGGKGVATYIGVLLGLYWPAALIFCAIWLIVAFTSRYSSLAAPGRQRIDAGRALSPRPAAHRRAVSVAQRAVVDHAPRQYRAPARRQRRQDRREEHNARLKSRLSYPRPCAMLAPRGVPGGRCVG